MSMRNVGATRLLTLLMGLMVPALLTAAEKKAPVRIYHPPSLGEALVGKRVVLGPVSGKCSQEFAALLVRDLRNRGITVFDRAGIDTVLREHDLEIRSVDDVDAAIALGRLVGQILG